jgi:hypothetical protein
MIDASKLPSISQPVSSFHFSCETPTDAPIYPGKLNFDKYGNQILTPQSKLTDYIQSIKLNAERYGAVHPSEWTQKYPNPAFPQEVVDPPGEDPFKPKNLNPLFGRLIPYLKNTAFKSEEDPLNSDIPMMSEPVEEFDYRTVMPDLNAKSMVGDPRISDGCIMQSVFQEFLPRIEAYTELLNSGGVSVEDNCICNKDGIKIAQASPLLLQVVNSSPNKKISPITAEEIINFVLEKREIALQAHADAFVEYINKKFPIEEWPYRKAFFMEIGFFFIKISKQPFISEMSLSPLSPEGTNTNIVNNFKTLNAASDIKFFRYYSDQKDYVVEKLKIDLETGSNLVFSSTSANAARDLSKDIPDYTQMI